MDRWDQDQLVPEWWEEKSWRRKELLMILSIPPHQWSMVVVVSWSGHVWLPVELVLLYLLMMWLLTKQQDEFWSVSGNIICSYSAKCFRTHWTALHSVQMDNDPKHTAKATKDFLRERSGLLCNGQVNHLTWIDLSMHFTCWRQNWGKMPQEQAGTEDGCRVEAWQSITRDETQRLVMSIAFQTSGSCNWLQRICNQVLKSESLIYDYYSVPLLLVPKQVGGTYANCCNSYTVHLIWM